MRECDRIVLFMTDVTLYVLNVSLIKDNYSFVLSYIDESRKDKAMKYVHEKDQLLSLGAAYLLKRYLPSGEIKETKTGKPYLEDGPFFNLSHSGEYVVLAVHPLRDVGVDIEKINEKQADTIKFVLTEKERNADDLNTLFQMWSNKESLTKCISTGITDIRKVDALPLEGIRKYNDEDFYSKSMLFGGYSLSITIKGNEPFNINLYNVNSLEER